MSDVWESPDLSGVDDPAISHLAGGLDKIRTEQLVSGLIAAGSTKQQMHYSCR